MTHTVSWGEQLGMLLLARGQTVSAAESCSGGLICAALTEVSGSSAWFERGFVTYSNAAKIEMLGVPQAMLETFGAVSEPVVRAMAVGARKSAQADWAVAVSGVAGPTGGSDEKPVGTVWLAWVGPGLELSECCHFDGDRAGIRAQTTQHALSRLVEIIREQK